MITNEKAHWDNIYATKAEDQVSWFQAYPKTSIQFLQSLALPLDARIIDVGGGNSRFVDILLDQGYQNIYVLDISGHAIERAKKRLGDRAINVNWIIADVTEFQPSENFDFWHDRAAFHFLTTDAMIEKYIAVAENSVKKNGYLVIGTFSDKGPTKCSGLYIKQYSQASLVERFKRAFEKVKCIEEDHTTPSNAIQNFVFCSFLRK